MLLFVVVVVDVFTVVVTVVVVTVVVVTVVVFTVVVFTVVAISEQVQTLRGVVRYLVRFTRSVR